MQLSCVDERADKLFVGWMGRVDNAGERQKLRKTPILFAPCHFRSHAVRLTRHP